MSILETIYDGKSCKNNLENDTFPENLLIFCLVILLILVIISLKAFPKFFLLLTIAGFLLVHLGKVLSLLEVQLSVPIEVPMFENIPEKGNFVWKIKTLTTTSSTFPWCVLFFELQ